MSVLHALIMGIVQGLTEFLPVSSSAHLVFADHFLHLRLTDDQTVTFDVLLHLGTLVAVLIYFRRDIATLLRGAGQLVVRPRQAWRENAFSRLAALLILGTIPAAIAGKSLQPFFQAAFQNVPGTAALLFLTAGMLIWITRRRTGERSLETANWKDALLIGAFQAFAILPGVSRSGSTITGGLLRGFDRDAAPRFSFLLAVPVILGGGLLDLKDTLETGFAIPTPQLAAGFLAAAVSGYLAVVLLMGIVRRGRLDRFAYYCVAAGAFMLAYWTLLVPKVSPTTIGGIVNGQPVALKAAGEMGPIPVDAPLQLRMIVQPGVVPVREAYALLPDGGRAAFVQQAGTDVFTGEIATSDPTGHAARPHPGGETRDVWVILRNRLGIQNEVRLRLFIVPTPSARPVA